MRKGRKDFLTCGAYRGHKRDVEMPNFSKFRKGKRYYFALLDDDENILLRGIGTKNSCLRKQRMKALRRNLLLDRQYHVLKRGQSFFLSLSSKNHSPIAISCRMDSEKDTERLGLLLQNTLWKGKAHQEGGPIKKKSGKKGSNKYLTCSKHKGHQKSLEYPSAAFFRHSNQKYYFSLFNEEDFVLLRSKGYRTITEREEAFTKVLDLMTTPERWEKQVGKNWAFLRLKDKDGNTFGKSCRFKEDEFDESWIYGGAALLTASSEKVTSVVNQESPVILPEQLSASLGIDESSNYIEEPIQKLAFEQKEEPIELVRDELPSIHHSSIDIVSEKKKGGFNWWWLLLLIPLLLFFLMLRSCMGIGDEQVVAVATEESAVIETVPEVQAAVEEIVALPSYTLDPIFFEFDSYALTLAATNELDEMAEILLKDDQLKGELYAHTDSKGSQAYNEKLSQNRANAALQYLLAKGIETKRIAIRTFGENAPVAKNQLDSGEDTERGREYNRRVELAIIDGNRVQKSQEIVVPESLK